MKAWAIGDEPVVCWRTAHEPFPKRLKAHVENGGKLGAHNAHFEHNIWAEQHRRAPLNWPRVEWSQWIDTMALARAAGFPAALGQCAIAMGLPIAKDDRGGALIRALSIPMKNGAFREDETMFQEFMRYCIRDVEVEREIHRRLPPLSEFEQQLWRLDAVINTRGVGIDLESARLALEIVTAETESLSQRVKTATNGAVSSAAQVGALRLFLLSEGIDVDKLNSDTVTRTLAKGVASDLGRELLELRKLAAKTSTGKLKAMLSGSTPEGNGGFGRARGLFAYWGADTGRWAARRIQPHNLPRTPEDFDGEDVIAALHQPNSREYLEAWYGSPMDAISWGLRSLICAEPGNKLIAVDLSNIEGRVLAWLAGETWKLDAFRAYDTIIPGQFDKKGKPLRAGPDLYMLAYARSFGIDIADVTKLMRLLGKVQELALGFQGGFGAFASMAANYGITIIEDDAERPETTGEVLTRSEVEKIKLGWRAAHPETVALWRRLNDCSLKAVQEPDKVIDAGCVSYRVHKNMLYCRLPSGRLLSYPYPSIEKTASYKWRTSCVDFANSIIDADPALPAPAREAAKHLRAVAPRGAERHAVTKLREIASHPIGGENQDVATSIIDGLRESMQPVVVLYGREKKYYDEYGKPKKARWGKWSAYGGLLVENCTQAVARDILAYAMTRLEAKGYEIMMHVHDEIVVSVPESFGSVNEMTSIMCELPKWARGLPIAAEGWTASKYRK